MAYTIKTLDDVKTFFSENFTEPIFYICTDPLHGLGLENVIPNYHIICLDDSPIVDYLLKNNKNIFCLERQQGKKNIMFRSSRHVLTHEKTLEYIKKHSLGKSVNLLFFKPFFEIDNLLKKKVLDLKVRVLNTKPAVNKLFENKLSFYETVKDLRLDIPKSVIVPLKDAHFNDLKRTLGNKLVVQFGRGWAGNTTYFMESEKQLKRLQEAQPYPKLVVKISKFIKGETFTLNACVTRSGILVGYPFFQITGISQLTRSLGGTCGNQWSNVKLKEAVLDKILKQTEILGKFMFKNGFLGYFGLDIVIEAGTGNIYISENNARLTASTPMYTKLEILESRLPLLIFHVFEFLGVNLKLNFELIKTASFMKLEGSQIVVRNTNTEPIEIKKAFPVGVYRWKEKEGLEYVKEGYSIKSLKKQDEFLVLVAAKGRSVNPDMEYIRIQTKGSFLDSKRALKSFVFSVVDEVKRWLN